jgi:hypothetical protein
VVIVHYHIYKNAGSSVEHILRSAFGERWASFEGDSPTSLLRPEALLTFVQQRPEVCAVSSHLLRPPAPAGLDVLPVTLIRHPLDRAFSVYSQERRGPENELHSSKVAKQTDFRRFVRWCLDQKSLGGMVITNYQVIHLSPASLRDGHIYRAVATEKDLLHAIDYLSDGACFGVVDRFGRAMARLRQMAANVGLPIIEANATENMTDGRPDELDTRLSIAREQLGPALYQRFREENELDYRLYEWAHALDS